MSVLSVCTLAHSASKGSDGIERQSGQPSIDWMPREGREDGGDGAGGDDSGNTPNGWSDAVQTWILTYSPQLQKLGFGGVMGICTGVALKRIGNGIAALVGVSFIGLQCLSYLGYIQIDYLKVSKDAQAVLDADRDGKLTEKDFVLVWKKFVDIMSFNVPGAGGFVVGLLIGIRAGN